MRRSIKRQWVSSDWVDKLDFYKEKRKGTWTFNPSYNEPNITIDAGTPITYNEEDKIDNRSAFGKALKDLGDKNISKGQLVCAFDCDLASSVKTSDFAKAYPDYFFQAGIQEHNTATAAGALSTAGVLTFFADFGVFGIDETYNQQRLNGHPTRPVSGGPCSSTSDSMLVPTEDPPVAWVIIGLARYRLRFPRRPESCPATRTRRRGSAIRCCDKRQYLIAMGRTRWPHHL